MQKARVITRLNDAPHATSIMLSRPVISSGLSCCLLTLLEASIHIKHINMKDGVTYRCCIDLKKKHINRINRPCRIYHQEYTCVCVCACVCVSSSRSTFWVQVEELSSLLVFVTPPSPHLAAAAQCECLSAATSNANDSLPLQILQQGRVRQIDT
jgi:hypothetical protein